MRSTRQWILSSLAVLLLFTTGFISTPAEAQSSKPAPTQQTFMFSIQIGSSTALVNGKHMQIKAPYYRNSTTMVPLDLIVSAFGMHYSKEDDDDSFLLSLGGRSIQMTIDDPKAVMNRHMEWMTEVPEFQHDQLMVPLRPIMESLQGLITYTKGGKITASWDSSNKHVDFSRIGSKEQGWSIDLPENWIYYQESKDTTIFIEPNLSVYVELLYQRKDYPYWEESMIFDYDDRGLMGKLMGKHLFKPYVKEKPNGLVGTIDGIQYAQLEYYEDIEEEMDIEDPSLDNHNAVRVSEDVYADLDRLYQSKTHFYRLSTTGMNKTSAESMLDSFRPYYTISPLGALTEPPHQVTETLAEMEPYGVSLMLPVTWSVSPGGFHDDSLASRWDNKQFISTNIHEASALLTASDMMQQYLKSLKLYYQSEAYQLTNQQTIRLKSGQSGVLQQMIMHDNEVPYTLYVLHVVDGTYGYHIELIDYNSNSGASVDNDNLLELITIDSSLVTETYSELDYMLEGQGTHQVIFDEINVSIQAPTSWKSECLSDLRDLTNCWLSPPFGDSMNIYKLEHPIPLEQAAELEIESGWRPASIKIIHDQYQLINGYQARIMDIAHSDLVGDKEELDYIRHVAYIQQGDDLYYVSISVEPDFSSYVKEQFMHALESFEVLP